MTQVKELLEAQVPLRSAAEPDWADVLHRAGLNGSNPRRTRRRILVPVLVTIVVLIVGVAIAAALDGIPWWENAPPPVHPQVVDYELNPGSQGDADLPAFHPDRKRARTVAMSKGAALVAAPVGKEGQCLLLFMPESDAPATGRSCIWRIDRNAPSVESGAFDDLRSWARPQSEIISAIGPRWVLYGRIADPRAATLDLSAAAGFTFRVALNPGGFFLVDVPKTDWPLLSNRVGEGKILDQAGGTLRAGCVYWGPAPGALGAGQEGGLWNDGLARCRPVRMPWSVETEDATKLVGITVREPLPGNAPGDSLAVWQATQKDGTVCVFKALASPKPHTMPSPSDRFPDQATYRNMPTEIVCDESADGLNETPPGRPIDVAIGGGATDGNWQYQLLGHVGADSSIRRLELTSARGPVPLAYENHWFVADLPAGGALHELPPGGPYTLVGYDGEGREVSRLDLQQALTRAEQEGCGGLNGMYECADREAADRG